MIFVLSSTAMLYLISLLLPCKLIPHLIKFNQLFYLCSTGIIYKDAPLANVQKQRRFSAVDETTLSAPSKWPGQ